MTYCIDSRAVARALIAGFWFQKKLVGHNTKIWIFNPPINALATALIDSRRVAVVNLKFGSCQYMLKFHKPESNRGFRLLILHYIFPILQYITISS